MSLELIQFLNKNGLRIFTIDDVRNGANELGLQSGYIPTLLSHLVKDGTIHSIIKGKYYLDNNLLAGAPLHEFEIASSISNDSTIAYLSAFSFQGLTDQVPDKVYAISFALADSSDTYATRYTINNAQYILTRMPAKNKWGIELSFIDEIQFCITDLERTLLDGLAKPHYCMGIREVLSAFEIAKDRLDIGKICNYTIDYGSIALQKRLGFILEKLGLKHCEIDRLKVIDSKVFQKLDILGERRGKYCREWMIIENL